VALLSDKEIEGRLEQLTDWQRKGDAIERDFKRDGGFVGAVDFVNALTPVAEEMNHHPDLSVSWDTVTVSISTHSEGGITGNDFELAKRIEALG